ncbi:MAG: Rieske (2Fe-2S) protein [Amphritea sp.]|nr:Rieske (2Fe-2S) protein [Amphritea sp.]
MTSLCQLNDLPNGSAKGFDIEGRKLFAVRKGDSIYLYENRCPHKDIPLEWMPDTFLDPDKQFIQCSTHGALFTIDQGLCIAGPCNGASLKPVEFEVIDNRIVI